jgi:hypothetical protein
VQLDVKCSSVKEFFRFNRGGGKQYYSKSMPGVCLAIGIVSVSMVLLARETGASDIDLHWLWDNRCADCHGHAGEFSRQFMNVDGNELQGRHHVHDLRRFMGNHYLSEEEVDAVYQMLFSLATSPGKYRKECNSCHDIAAEFVRSKLVLRDGTLYGRGTGRPVHEFLEVHRGLEPEDVDFYMELLTRVAGEVYRP